MNGKWSERLMSFDASVYCLLKETHRTSVGLSHPFVVAQRQGARSVKRNCCNRRVESKQP
jgi:hypothetical protein